MPTTDLDPAVGDILDGAADVLELHGYRPGEENDTCDGGSVSMAMAIEPSLADLPPAVS